MVVRARCPECQSAGTWPDYARSRQVRCPKCQHRFFPEAHELSEPEELPELMPVVQASGPRMPEELPEAVPVADVPREQNSPSATPSDVPILEGEMLAEATEVALSPSLLELREDGGESQLSVHQRTVYALLLKGLGNYSAHILEIIIGIVLMPFLLVLGIGLCLLLMLVVYWVLAAVGWLVGPWTNSALYLFPAIVFAFARVIREQGEAAKIEVTLENGLMDRLKLGRFEDIFNISATASLTFFFGSLVGLQIGLLYLTNDHLGLPIAGGFGECVLLTLDNLCHGIFLDTFELYDINLGAKMQHTFWSATVFYIFRLAFDAVFLLFLYALYQRYAMRRFFKDFPSHLMSWSPPASTDNVAELVEWVEDKCGEEEGWPRKFFDEFLFLTLATEYLRGDFKLVRQLSTRFSRLRVTKPIRQLFVAPNREVIFYGEEQPSSG